MRVEKLAPLERRVVIANRRRKLIRAAVIRVNQGCSVGAAARWAHRIGYVPEGWEGPMPSISTLRRWIRETQVTTRRPA